MVRPREELRYAYLAPVGERPLSVTAFNIQGSCTAKKKVVVTCFTVWPQRPCENRIDAGVAIFAALLSKIRQDSDRISVPTRRVSERRAGTCHLHRVRGGYGADDQLTNAALCRLVRCGAFLDIYCPVTFAWTVFAVPESRIEPTTDR